VVLNEAGLKQMRSNLDVAAELREATTTLVQASLIAPFL